MQVGKLNPQNGAKINYPGFQEILDFTSAGSESSVSVAVDGDTDKEYKIVVRNLDTSDAIICRLNSDAGTNYGTQYIANISGTISAVRGTTDTRILYFAGLSLNTCTLLTPTGFIKTAFRDDSRYTSGTTIGIYLAEGSSWNNTANVTSLNFSINSGNFTSGTRITVLARRSN